MSRLLLIDGSNLLFQMFFGMPARIVNAQGRAIQGTLGFVGALLKIIRQVRPTHVAVLFDGAHESARAALDPAYKANRPDYADVPEEENPYSQLGDVYAALDFLGIRRAETTCCEVDDWMAGYAQAYGGEMEIVISSFDSDFFQLVAERVSVLRYRGEKTVICTPAYIEEKFGIRPDQYADYKALVGDAADNIRGAAHVGPKTAAVLLVQYGTLEALLERAGEMAKPAVRASLLGDADRLRRNKALIALTGGALLPFAIGELAYTDGGLSTGDVLRGIGLR